jgi:hypothetical protein
MNELANKSNLKKPTHLDAQSVKFNPLIQEKSYQNPKNPIFMNF